MEARAAGFGSLFLYASDARTYYPRFGWTHVAEDIYEDTDVLIMRKDLLS
jgi:hypothetical protein